MVTVEISEELRGISCILYLPNLSAVYSLLYPSFRKYESTTSPILRFGSLRLNRRYSWGIRELILPLCLVGLIPITINSVSNRH